MSKYLVIVESPAKAKTIEKFLGKNYKVVASVGHVRDLPKSKMGIDIEDNYEPKYITIRGKGDVIKDLRSKAKKAEKIFLATDPDREGEAIAWHLAFLLGLDVNDKCRVTFHEITKSAIREAIKHPTSINMNLVDAQQGRRVLDRLVGYSISPILWRKIRRGLSAGRVQSVATKLICDREDEINAFESEEYWEIQGNFKKINGSKEIIEGKFVSFKEEKIELKTLEDANMILENTEGKNAKVESILKKEKSRSPHFCFTTSSLQQEAANKLGFSTKKTMIIAQQLYEGINIKGHGNVGLITYMRTDSKRISEEAKESLKNYIIENIGEEYLSNEFRKEKNGKNSQDAHEAIRPTSVIMTPVDIEGSFTKDQYKLYKLIWERFVAFGMKDAKFHSVTVSVKCADSRFKLSGLELKFDGFLKVYSAGTFNEKILPELSEVEELSVESIVPSQHFTQPPARYSEASLVKEMEEKGIGRPSTYAPTISTILSRGYVERVKKMLAPTELGFLINDIMKNYFKQIVNANFTASMESEFDKIEEGNVFWKDIIKEFYSEFEGLLENANNEIEKIDLTEKTDIKCEKCGSYMNIKHGRFGKFLACSNYPECDNTKAILNKIGVSCPVCKEGDVVERKTKKFKTFYGCSRFPECNFVNWNKPTGEYCPECGSYLIEKNSKKEKIIKCSNKECKYEKEIVEGGK